MQSAKYEVIEAGDGFSVVTDGTPGELIYVTKEAALEAIKHAAHIAISDGLAVEVRVPGGPGRWPKETLDETSAVSRVDRES